ncbi:hypothetical protein [Malaciobacter mytili]|uniref:hypothetical protein n=1 Tax=Malaciobacter mytili TaxID=603050 RepID=UPI003A8ADD9D
MKKLIFITIFFTILNNSLNATTTTKDLKEITDYSKKDKLLIGYYGRPNAASLGILGESNIDEVINKMKQKEKYFNKELENNFDIELAFHIIHSLATKDAGRRNDYLLGMSEESVMKYINRAKKEGFSIIIDLQLGTYTPAEAIKPVLKYLKYENVHLAIDPEFKIPKHRKYPPGKYIGHIYGNELNEAQELISNYLKQNNILEKKNLIVHMFHERMLRDKEAVQNYDNINLIYNIDGHGKGEVKVKIYNSLYANSQTNKAIGGFKIFYNNDKKPLMTPKQIMGLEPVGTQKIMVKPYYINFH